MVGLLAVAAVATRGGNGDSTAPPGTAAAATAGHHVLIVAALVLTPILAIIGVALFMYAQIYRRRELDPELRAAPADRAHPGRDPGDGRSWPASPTGLRTGHNPIAFLHLRNPFAGAAQSHGPGPRLHRPTGPHGSVSSTDWTDRRARLGRARRRGRHARRALTRPPPRARAVRCSRPTPRTSAVPIWTHCGASATPAAP